jgi:hypothetical protein
MRHAVLAALLLCPLGAAVPGEPRLPQLGAAPRTLTLDERVAAQRAIEGVYWRHRIWPEANPTPKPSLDEVMPASAIRRKVEDSLKKSNALEKFWGTAVTAAELQAEINRMTVDTRSPDVLREIFGALDDDPSVIAETLARETLAERRLRTLYASDDRFHGAIRRMAEKALSDCHDVACMKDIGGEYAETTAKLQGDDDPDGAANSDATALTLDPEQWTSYLDRLASRISGSPDVTPTRHLSPLQETPDAFVVTAVLSRRAGEVVTATTSWPKLAFDSWWQDQRATLPTEIEHVNGTFTLPAITLTGCTNDTWSPTHQDVPDGREYHSRLDRHGDDRLGRTAR